MSRWRIANNLIRPQPLAAGRQYSTPTGRGLRRQPTTTAVLLIRWSGQLVVGIVATGIHHEGLLSDDKAIAALEAGSEGVVGIATNAGAAPLGLAVGR